MGNSDVSVIDKQRIKQNLHICDVLEFAGIPASREETDFFIPCPLHGEQNASCHINTVKNVWHCFSCNKCGDVISLVMALYRRDFLSALAYIAEQWPQVARCSVYPGKVLDIPVKAGTGEVALSVPVARVSESDREQRRYDARQRERYSRRMPKVHTLTGTPGEAYLLSRGIPLAQAKRVCYSENWRGRPAVVFIGNDSQGKPVAAEGRYIDVPSGMNKCSCWGEKSQAIFPAGKISTAKTLVLVEGQINALSLAVAGIPAIATFGANNLPAWLPDKLKGRHVVLSFDNDSAGENATYIARETLTRAGVSCAVWQLPKEEGDHNDILIHGGIERLAELARQAGVFITK